MFDVLANGNGHARFTGPVGRSVAQAAARPVPVSGQFLPIGDPIPGYRLDGLFARDRPPDLTKDTIVSDIFIAPYRSPIDFSQYNLETPDIRYRYRVAYSTEPAVKSAVERAVFGVANLKPTVMPPPGDETLPLATVAAEFCDWAVQNTARGWPGLITDVLLPARVDGFSLAELKMHPVPRGLHPKWGGLWGLTHVRPLDSAWLRLQLDLFRNVISVVNLVRGLEYYSPSEVVLYSHNPVYNVPFGQSDLRATTRAANILQDVYQVWYVALKVYGWPYMHGKVKDQTKRAMMETALKALRAGGWAVTHADDDITVLSLASATNPEAFRQMVMTLREDVNLVIHGVSTPFQEGQGNRDGHHDTEVASETSDSYSAYSAASVSHQIGRQVFGPLVASNFPPGTPVPVLRLGMANIDKMGKVLDMLAKAQQVGIRTKASWAYEMLDMPPGVPGDTLDPPGPPDSGAGPGDPAGPGGGGGPGRTGPGGGGGGQPAPDGTPAPPPPAPGEPQPGQPPAEPPAARMSSAAERVAELAERVFAAAAGRQVFSSDMRTADIHADPDRFQFRRGADGDDGTARKLPAERFNPGRCKSLAVWDDPEDGRTYVVDGHHRLAWAERDGVEMLPVTRIDARTAAEAKAIGKRLNRASQTFSADFASGYDEKQHPRDDHGRFVDAEELGWAKDDPGVAAELRQRVTDPAERAKLEAAISGKATPEPAAPAPTPVAPQKGTHNEHVPDPGARPDLTPDEAAAAREYTEWAYDDLNPALRKTGRPTPKTAALHAALTAAFARTKPFARPVEANRAMALRAGVLEPFLDAARKAQQAGGEFEMTGYVSTTADPAYKPDPGANVQLKINATRGLDLMPYSMFPEQERELLLNHGSRFKVTGVQQVGRQWVVSMDQVA